MAPNGLDAFERGEMVARIVERVERSGEWVFVIEALGQENPLYVPASVASIACPQEVIAFYEPRMADNRQMIPGLNVYHFDEGLEPEQVIRRIDTVEGRLFTMVWKNTYSLKYVRVAEANLVCPALVIQFYERWYNSRNKFRL